MPGADYLALARESSREGFIAACGYNFLFSRGTLHPPLTPRSTLSIMPTDEEDEDVEVTLVGDLPGMAAKPRPASEPIILAVLKVKDVFPNMITVGRTNNNDIVLKDISISRFHAVFNLVGDQVKLSDAGSRNGTYVDSHELGTRAPAIVVDLRSRVRFGKVNFQLLDAGSVWDKINQR